VEIQFSTAKHKTPKKKKTKSSRLKQYCSKGIVCESRKTRANNGQLKSEKERSDRGGNRDQPRLAGEKNRVIGKERALRNI